MKLHDLMFTVGNSELIDLIEVMGIVGAGILIIFAFRKMIFPIMLRLAHVSQLDLNGRIISSIKLPITLGILILSGYLATTIALDLSSDSLKSVNHIVGVLGLVAAYVLIQRSANKTGTVGVKNYLPTEAKKSSHLSAMNQFPVTVEEEVISKMLPSTNNRDLMPPEFKPVLDNIHDAGLAN